MSGYKEVKHWAVIDGDEVGRSKSGSDFPTM